MVNNQFKNLGSRSGFGSSPKSYHFILVTYPSSPSNFIQIFLQLLRYFVHKQIRKTCRAEQHHHLIHLIAVDTNDLKCLGFYSVKPRKVRGRSTSPEGRAVLHQATDESFVYVVGSSGVLRKDFA